MNTVGLEWRAGWARLTLNRPEALNALNQAMLTDLRDAVAAAEARPDVRVLLIDSATPKAFAAGADIREIAALASAHEAAAFAARGQAILEAVAESRLVTLAAVGGYALGGGLELALSCDLRLVGRSAWLGLPETTLGIMPGYGGTQRLPRLIGETRALWMILTGERIDATRAEAWGLAHAVVDDADLGPRAQELAERLAAGAPLALELAKKAVRVGHGLALGDGLTLEAQLFGLTAATEDAREGTQAFLERRRPVFDRSSERRP